MDNLPLIIGSMVVVGCMSGASVKKIKLPMITDYIIAGLLIGPAALNLVPESMVDSMEVFTSIALGIIAYSIGTSLQMSRIREQWKSILVITPVQCVGAVILCVGVSSFFGLSEILSNMVIGFVVVNRIKNTERVNVFDDVNGIVFYMFFVLAGMHFHLDSIRVAGILAALVIASRFSGKYLGTIYGATISHSPDVVKKYLGFALLPKAGVTIGLALLAQSAFPSFGTIIYNSILASVVINELIAPPLVKYAIFKAGEQTSVQPQTI